jgi:hypothetical protein
MSSTSEDLATRIAVLEAREHVKELRARYAWFAARGQFEGIASLFAVDGVFEAFTGTARQRFSGQAAIREFLSRSMTSAGMVFPMIHNHIIEVRGDEAVGTCAMESRATPGGPYPNGFAGYYHDRARRVNGRWLFTERCWYLYNPVFERSGLNMVGMPEG